MTYYSQSKGVIHLSNKSTLQLISQKVFQKVIMWPGYKEFFFSWNTKCTNSFVDYGYNLNRTWRTSLAMTSLTTSTLN